MSKMSQQERPNEMNPAHIHLDGSDLNLQTLESALDRPIHVDIAKSAWEKLMPAMRVVQLAASSPTPAYGVNTGFGHLCNKKISSDQVEVLQRNLIMSHAVGVGPDAPPSVVRLMMLLKIHALLHGASGVSPALVERIALLLNEDCLPRVPVQGSLGASGDLAPLAHMVLPLLGLGEVTLNGQPMSAASAYERLKVVPVTLGPKEGLALVNGTQFMLAYAVHAACRARRLVRLADVIACMSLEGAAGSLRPFDSRLHKLRPHPGAMQTADNISRMMAGSEILESHKNCNRVQDPYSLRCIPQVHGASRDALRHAEQVIEIELNSVTDNPVVLDSGEIISGGLFHGQSLALVLDYLAIALAELASISERRIYLLLSGIGGLPILLTNDAGINSGLMLPQYTAAALVSENKGLCMPASVDSIPTSLGQEDHVSMGARAAVKCLQVLENTETVLAIEQFCAAQALDFRSPLKPSASISAAHTHVRRTISHADCDRLFGEDIKMSLELIRSDDLIGVVEAILGSFH